MIEKILKDFGSTCYWYGEETGDYDMASIEETEFYKKAVKALKKGGRVEND